MTNDAELDMVASRVSSLESRVASVESQGSPEDAGVKAGQDGAPQPTVDPKGRKIWEAEWRQDYGVLLAYVPDNALVIDGENVEVEADDKDGDEVTVTAGTWYLHIYKNESGEGYSADFDDSATGSRDGENAKFNIKIFDIHEDGYVEKQYVVGSIVMGGGSGDDNEDRKYFADERSLSLVGQESSDPTQNFTANHFHLRGFGKFSADGYTQSIGTFAASSLLKIGTRAKNGLALVARIGDSDGTNFNSLGYVRPYVDVGEISSDLGKWPSAFEYVEYKDNQGLVVSRSIVRNVFEFDGEIVELDDYAIPSGGSTGTVYLRGRQPAPTSQDADPDWTWTIGDAELEPQSGGRALNFPLYDWADGKVSCDYRTTFLSITNPYTKAKIEIKKPGESSGIVLDASGSSPKVSIIGKNHGSIDLDTSDLGSSESVGLHSVIDADGNEVAKILSTENFEIPESDGSPSVEADGKSVEFTSGTVGDSDPDSDGGSGGGDGGTSKLQIKGFATAQGEAESIVHDLIDGNTGVPKEYLIIVKDGDTVKYVPIGMLPDDMPKEITVDDDGKNCTVIPVKGESFKIPLGKTISKVDVSNSASPGGTSTMVFHYSDGSSDTFCVQNGINGQDSGGGEESSSIEVEDDPNEVRIFVDGDLAATIPKNNGPTIEAEKDGKVTSIMVDGVPIATIADGEDGEDGDDGEDGKNGTDASVTVEASEETQSDGSTATRVTITPYTGGIAGTPASFVVKNGNGLSGEITYVESIEWKGNKIVGNRKKLNLTTGEVEDETPCEIECSPHSKEHA